MIHQIPLGAAAAASSRLLLSTCASPFFTTTRLVSTVTVMTTKSTKTKASSLEKTSSSKTAADSESPAPAPRQLKYLVQRTHTNNLPVYKEARSGGTRKETVIRKIVGSSLQMKDDIIQELKFKKDDVNVNPVTNHIRIKGHYAGKIVQWLEARGF